MLLLLSRCFRARKLSPCRTCHRLLSTKARDKLPKTPARTRFAPSPTGYLHIGSLRTALFSYLLAKRTGGQFVLRIEDTDRSRTVADAEERLCASLRWAGLNWDEGPDIGGPYGPYRQSERVELHQKHADQLLQSGYAYRCFCSAERLQTLAAHRAKNGLPSEYDRTCVGVSAEQSDKRVGRGESYVIRLKVPDEYPAFQDLVYGLLKPGRTPLRHGLPSYEDPILIKSDGIPTYHLANVVDDHLMKITHVVRATEWIASTPKHLYLYKAFNWTPPAFAHVGLLQDKNRQKLSKRDKSLDIDFWRDEGYLPEALVNHVALMGWSHQKPSDIMTLQNLEETFDLRLTKGNTIVTIEKLRFLQHKHAMHRVAEGGAGLEELVDQVYAALVDFAPEALISFAVYGREERDYVRRVLEACVNDYVDPKSFCKDHTYLFDLQKHPLQRSFDSGELKLHAASLSALLALRDAFEEIPASNWSQKTTEEAIKTHLSAPQPIRKLSPNNSDSQEPGSENGEQKERAMPDKERKRMLNQALRYILAGERHGPGLGTIMELLGRDITLERITDVLQMSRRGGASALPDVSGGR